MQLVETVRDGLDKVKVCRFFRLIRRLIPLAATTYKKFMY